MNQSVADIPKFGAILKDGDNNGSTGGDTDTGANETFVPKKSNPINAMTNSTDAQNNDSSDSASQEGNGQSESSTSSERALDPSKKEVVDKALSTSITYEERHREMRDFANITGIPANEHTLNAAAVKMEHGAPAALALVDASVKTLGSFQLSQEGIDKLSEALKGIKGAGINNQADVNVLHETGHAFAPNALAPAAPAKELSGPAQRT